MSQDDSAATPVDVPPGATQPRPTHMALQPAAGAAPGGWFPCDVLKVGVRQDNLVVILLRDRNGAFPARYYGTPTAVSREFLAAALSAMTAQYYVWVDLTTTDEWGTVQELHVTSPGN